MKNDRFIKEAVESILKKEGRDALEAWTFTVSEIKSDVNLVKEIHGYVGKHLARQIEKTFSIDRTKK